MCHSKKTCYCTFKTKKSSAKIARGHITKVGLQASLLFNVLFIILLNLYTILRFIESYRVNKDIFKMLLDKIGNSLAEKHRFITPTTQLAATLRFLATGSYQLGIAKDQDINIGRSTFSKVLHFVIQELESCLCPGYIQLNMSPAEMNASKEHFYREFNFPGVIGCVDGTHIKILKPKDDESLFFNRKGYFSINAMVVKC